MTLASVKTKRPAREKVLLVSDPGFAPTKYCEWSTLIPSLSVHVMPCTDQEFKDHVVKVYKNENLKLN